MGIPLAPAAARRISAIYLSNSVPAARPGQVWRPRRAGRPLSNASLLIVLSGWSGCVGGGTLQRPRRRQRPRLWTLWLPRGPGLVPTEHRRGPDCGGRAGALLGPAVRRAALPGLHIVGGAPLRIVGRGVGGQARQAEASVEAPPCASSRTTYLRLHAIETGVSSHVEPLAPWARLQYIGGIRGFKAQGVSVR